MIRYPLGSLIRDLRYDEADRISSYLHYDAVSGTASPAFDQRFSYDALGRLTFTQLSNTTWSFAYDANGNRTISSVGTSARAYSVAADSNRLNGLSNPQRTFSYDASGNLISDVSAGAGNNYTASYNHEARLGSMVLAGAKVDLAYDAQGRRIRRVLTKVGGLPLPPTTNFYAYDLQGHLIGEYNQLGAISEYIWLGDMPVAVITPAPDGADIPFAVFFVHADHLDAPRVLVDQQNQLRWRWMAEPFGVNPAETTPTSGLPAVNIALRLPGQQFDSAAGLHYNMFRDYDPTVGRYVQSDPIGLDGGLNTYAYVGGNPVNDIDPTGEFGLLGGVVGGLGDLGYQLYKNGGNFKCVNWWEVGSWALTGSGAGIVGRAGLTGVANFFSNANKFRNISRGYWAARGGANGMSLDHWMISQAAGRSGAVSESIVNGGWNLLEMPASWNTWLGFAPNWGGTQAAMANAARLGIQMGVPGIAAASGYAGYQVGTNAQQQQCGCQ